MGSWVKHPEEVKNITEHFARKDSRKKRKVNDSKKNEFDPKPENVSDLTPDQ